MSEIPDPADQPSSSGRLWLFRIVASLVLPLAALALLEGALRLLGVGHEMGFTRSCEVEGVPSRCDNPYFTHAFFPARLARTPVSFAFAAEKPAGAFRAVVLGGSAAQGDPDPTFGLPRLLELLLRDRLPGARVEVINGAITAVNSHVMLPAARDVLNYDPDLLVVYLGNNEVVGPFGAGTVFSPLVSSRTLIRVKLALRRARLGQLLARLLEGGADDGAGEWKGMEMFLGHRIRSGDPRLETMYDHFRANLEDIVSAAGRARVPVLLSTVAANLRDCAPFASLHDEALGAKERAAWEDSFRAGLEAEGREAREDALAAYHEAEALDGGFAELAFRIARVQERRGETVEARLHYRQALELDALRFRADDRVNRVIREVATARRGEGVILVEGAETLAALSPLETSGEEYLDDHVHPNIEGNHLLAEEIILALEPLLARHPGAAPAPVLPAGVEACAARLAHTGFDRSRVATEIYRRFGRAPFTGQSTNEEERARLRREIEALGWFTTPEGLAAADEAYREALELAPEDPWLRFNRGGLLSASGRFEEAAGAYRAFLEHLPQDVPAREKLSSSLAAAGRFEEAASACRALIADQPDFTPPYYTLAYSLARLGRLEESLAVYREVLPRDPASAARVWTEMATILTHLGREKEAREASRRAAEVAGEREGPPSSP